MSNLKIIFCTLFSLSFTILLAQTYYPDNIQSLDSLKDASLNILEQNLLHQSGWNKVHAAEYLLWTKHNDGVQNVFIKEDELFGTEPKYRIGIWRVLAQVPSSRLTQDKWEGKILNAFINTSSPDRIHAAETLSKLKISPLNKNRTVTLNALGGKNKELSLYVHWAICNTSHRYHDREQKWFLDFLQNKNEDSQWRGLAAYIIGRMGELPIVKWKRLSGLALKEPMGNNVKMYLLSSSIITAPKRMISSPIYQKLSKALKTNGIISGEIGKIQMALTIAKMGNQNDLPISIDLLKENPSPIASKNADIHSAASYAILCIYSRLMKVERSYK